MTGEETPPMREIAPEIAPEIAAEIAATEIAVLVPCYNEAQAIAKVVADFRAALPEAVI